MKKFFLLAFLLPVLATAQTTTITPKKAERTVKATPTVPATPTAPDAPVDPNAPAFNFNEETWDFGSIPQGVPVTHVYEFVNSGKQPLEIRMESTSCGCTTPEFTKDAVNPGVKGKIAVTYDAAKAGPFKKSVTIQSNTGSIKYLYIKGTVLPKATTPATEEQ